MATILVPGFLRWDGTKYILDPDVEGSTGPTITNSDVGVLPDVVSDKNGTPAEIGATWRFFGAKSSTSFDWRTASYHTNTVGASSWNAVVTGDATITVTGQAGTSINWKVYGRFI